MLMIEKTDAWIFLGHHWLLSSKDEIENDVILTINNVLNNRYIKYMVDALFLGRLPVEHIY